MSFGKPASPTSPFWKRVPTLVVSGIGTATPACDATCLRTATNSRSRPNRTGNTSGQPVTRSSNITMTSSKLCNSNSHLKLGCEVTSAVFAEEPMAGIHRGRRRDRRGLRRRRNRYAAPPVHPGSFPALTRLPDRWCTPRAGLTSIHAGKRVAVIGTGSTGTQVFSALQPEAAHITHFARTPQWVMWMPMGMRQPRIVGRMLRALPKQRQDGPAIAARSVPTTWSTWSSDRPGDGGWPSATAWICLRTLVRDKDLRARLTPDYQPFCKRQVISGNYYRRISKPNASFVNEPIAEVTETGLRTTDGVHHDLDAIVLATGFQAHNYMRPMTLRGRDGLSIDDAWAKGPRAWGMTAIPGFPNLFTVLGPNSPTGSMSLQHVAELDRRAISPNGCGDSATARSPPSKSPRRPPAASPTTSPRRWAQPYGTPVATRGTSPTTTTSICGHSTESGLTRMLTRAARRRLHPHPVKATATSAANRALDSTRATLAAIDAPCVSRWKKSSRNGVTSLPRTPGRFGGSQAGGKHPVVQRAVHLVGRRDGVGQHQPVPVGAQPASGAQHVGDLCRRVHPPTHRVAGIGQVEAGEPVGAVADHPDVEGLQPLQSGRRHRGSTSRPRRPPARRCARGSSDPRTRPSCRARRDARRPARRWRTP